MYSHLIHLVPRPLHLSDHSALSGVLHPAVHPQLLPLILCILQTAQRANKALRDLLALSANRGTEQLSLVLDCTSYIAVQIEGYFW